MSCEAEDSGYDSTPFAARFPVRQGNVQALAANLTETTPAAGAFVEIFAAEAAKQWPRVITVTSNSAQGVGGLLTLPFDVQVEWTAGGIGVRNTIICSAVRGFAQVSVVATSVRVSVANWLNIPINVYAGVDAGYIENKLHRVVREINLAAAATQATAVPSYARDVEVQANQAGLLPNIVINFPDTTGGFMLGNTAAAGRIPVPPSATCRVTNGNPGIIASYMLDYTLDM